VTPPRPPRAFSLLVRAGGICTRVMGSIFWTCCAAGLTFCRTSLRTPLPLSSHALDTPLSRGKFSRYFYRHLPGGGSYGGYVTRQHSDSFIYLAASLADNLCARLGLSRAYNTTPSGYTSQAPVPCNAGTLLWPDRRDLVHAHAFQPAFRWHQTFTCLRCLADAFDAMRHNLGGL